MHEPRVAYSSGQRARSSCGCSQGRPYHAGYRHRRAQVAFRQCNSKAKGWYAASKNAHPRCHPFTNARCPRAHIVSACFVVWAKRQRGCQAETRATTTRKRCSAGHQGTHTPKEREAADGPKHKSGRCCATCSTSPDPPQGATTVVAAATSAHSAVVGQAAAQQQDRLQKARAGPPGDIKHGTSRSHGPTSRGWHGKPA